MKKKHYLCVGCRTKTPAFFISAFGIIRNAEGQSYPYFVCSHCNSCSDTVDQLDGLSFQHLFAIVRDLQSEALDATQNTATPDGRPNDQGGGQ